MLADAAVYLWSHQADDGGWHSATHGLVSGGQAWTPFILHVLLSAEEDWEAWHAKMNNLLSKVQNQNGSWSGHHCITSPVFCTAAVVMAMTADRDLQLLLSQQTEFQSTDR